MTRSRKKKARTPSDPAPKVANPQDDATPESAPRPPDPVEAGERGRSRHKPPAPAIRPPKR